MFCFNCCLVRPPTLSQREGTDSGALLAHFCSKPVCRKHTNLQPMFECTQFLVPFPGLPKNSILYPFLCCFLFCVWLRRFSAIFVFVPSIFVQVGPWLPTGNGSYNGNGDHNLTASRDDHNDHDDNGDHNGHVDRDDRNDNMLPKTSGGLLR